MKNCKVAKTMPIVLKGNQILHPSISYLFIIESIRSLHETISENFKVSKVKQTSNIYSDKLSYPLRFINIRSE